MRYAVLNESDSRRLIQQVDGYFSSLGASPPTTTRIPGDSQPESINERQAVGMRPKLHDFIGCREV
jgi:hypothetical protein